MGVERWEGAPGILVALMVVVHGADSLGRLRKHSSKHADFSGEAWREGRLWTTVSSSLVHNNWAHMLKQCYLLLTVGHVVEAATGSLLFVVLYYLCGAGAVLGG